MNRPHDRGYMIHWNLQAQIWSLESYWKRQYGFNFEGGNLDLILTEPPFNPDSLRSSQNEFIFEQFGFRSLLCCNPSFLALQAFSSAKSPQPVHCCVVVDCGYSFTHVIPYYDGIKVNHAVKRINVGGKLLTNYLKEVISYRYFNMMDETFITNIIKERLCYVSLDFQDDMKNSRTKGKQNRILKQYVLPDLATTTLGYVIEDGTQVHDNAQILNMNNERFTIPELLFNPSLIGIEQCGIPEAILNSINDMPEEVKHLMYQNIILVGGSSQFPGFKERIECELRRIVPQDILIGVFLPDNPETYSWSGGVDLATKPQLESMRVTKKEYDEVGDILCKQKFSLI